MTFRAFGQYLRRFLFVRLGRDTFVFFFFLIVSAGFWLLQMLDDTFETEITIPLQLKDVPEDVVITTPLPDALQVTVRDKGTSLFRYWRNKIPPVEFSFTDYAGGYGNGRVVIPRTDVAKIVSERLMGTSKVQALQPDTLEFYYNHGRHQTVPVAITGSVEPNPRYYLLSLVVEPSEVEVFASSSVLDTLTTVRTLPLDFSDLKESTTAEVSLRPIRGAKMEPAKVQVTATLDVYMEQSMEVPVVSLNFPGGKQLRTFPSTVKVTYTVGYAHSKELSHNSFVCAVTYEEILELQKQGATKIPVHLKSLPDGVTGVRVQPEELDYLIESVMEED